MKHLLLIPALSAFLLVAACDTEERADGPDGTQDEAAEHTQPPAETARQDVNESQDTPSAGGEHLLFTPEDIDWQPGPEVLEEGAEIAVLEGNPGEEGFFTMRARFPDGYSIAPHSHPGTERITVLSGAFLLGMGEEADREATERLEAGSYTSLAPETHHYVFTEGETTIQLTSEGPWELNYINPEDDPRERTPAAE